MLLETYSRGILINKSIADKLFIKINDSVELVDASKCICLLIKIDYGVEFRYPIERINKIIGRYIIKEDVSIKSEAYTKTILSLKNESGLSTIYSKVFVPVQ